jgi:hypothetical protein
VASGTSVDTCRSRQLARHHTDGRGFVAVVRATLSLRASRAIDLTVGPDPAISSQELYLLTTDIKNVLSPS